MKPPGSSLDTHRREQPDLTACQSGTSVPVGFSDGVDDSILDDLFHGCSLAAYLEQAALQQTWPDSEATRRRANRLYEETLAEKNARTMSPLRPNASPEPSTALCAARPCR